MALMFSCTFSHAQFITNSGIVIHNGADVMVNGDWSNASGTLIINNGVIRTSEDFVNNGSLDPASTGGFVLNFSVNKNFQPGGSNMGFLHKTGSGNAMVTGTIGIRDSLTLKNGIIQMVNPSDTLALRANAVVFPSVGSYVEGLVSNAGTGNKLFPLGRDNYYLPLLMHRANAKKLTASVIPVPAGITAGPGLDSLINFPYAWKVAKQLSTDTAAYVEVNYPSALPTSATAIIAKEIPGLKFASMGARLATNAAGRATVRSYSRAAQGLFTVAAGFQQDFVTDSLALVTLYNSTGGSTWTNRTNWLTGHVDTWSGVTVNGQSITAVALNGRGLINAVPDQLVDIASLQTLNLSGNALTAIPDFKLNDEITSLNVSNNKLTFASLEPNASVPGLIYSGQATLGSPSTTTVEVGTPVTLNVNAGGQSSVYQWKRNGVNVPGATNPTLEIPALGKSTMGDYVAEVTNPLLPGLTLKSAVQKTQAYADIAGKLYIEPTVAATHGTLRLYQVKTTKFEVVDTVFVNSDGSYLFDNVILDNYQVLGFADTLTYERALPTYYESTIFWEEADTVFLENHVSNLNIVSALEPLPSSGHGFIAGFLEEEVPDGRAMKPKRVAGAGVSVRRVENTGRGKGEVLTLVAYVFTDENGEFTLPNLSPANYRLNIQYPGYPMDETSFITVPIGTGLQSQVSVEAHVQEGKINVRKMIITGFDDSEKFQVKVFPNPAIDVIHLEFDETSPDRTIDMTGLSGNGVMAEKADGKNADIIVRQLPKGLYVLRIRQGSATVKTLKVSIE